MFSTKNSIKKVFAILLALLVVNTILVLLIPFKAPKVLETSIPDSPLDAQIRISFSELMDKKSVKDNLNIDPPLNGNISWSGKTLVYTPNQNLAFDQEYKISLNAQTKSKNGTIFEEEWQTSFKTKAPSFYYISTEQDSYGILKKYSLSTSKTEDISPENYIIKSYDYSNTQNLIVALALSKEEFKKDKDQAFKPYIIDPQNKDFIPIERLHKEEYKYHHLKWIPFENQLLIARTKLLQIDNSLKLASLEAEDTELALYDLDLREINSLKQGSTLAYEFHTSPDGSKVLLIDQEGNLILHSLRDDGETLITKDFLNHFGFSEYGNFLLYTVKTAEEIWPVKSNLIIQKSTGEKESVLKDLEGTISNPSFAANEKFIAFTYYDENKYTDYSTHNLLALYSLKEDKTEFLSSEEASVEETSFAPNSKFIAYISTASQALHEYKETGWNDNYRELVGGKIQIYDIEARSNSALEIEGTNIEWIY